MDKKWSNFRQGTTHKGASNCQTKSEFANDGLDSPTSFSIDQSKLCASRSQSESVKDPQQNDDDSDFRLNTNFDWSDRDSGNEFETDKIGAIKDNANSEVTLDGDQGQLQTWSRLMMISSATALSAVVAFKLLKFSS